LGDYSTTIVVTKESYHHLLIFSTVLITDVQPFTPAEFIKTSSIE
jgi:hypothetical protein